MTEIANTPEPPYYAAIFTTVRTEGDHGYGQMAERMMELAAEQPGFLGVESVRDKLFGITVSFWQSHEAILNWKQNAEHLIAQQYGRSKWYADFKVRISRVERDYGN